MGTNVNMNRKRIVIVAILVAVIGSAVAIWRVREARARAHAEKLESQILKQLSADDVSLIVKSQAESDPKSAEAMKEGSQVREALLKSLQETLALAAQARREGLSEDQNFIINAEFKKNFLLQTLYMAKLNKEQGKSFYKPEELDAVWTNPQNETQFKQDIATLEALQKVYAESRGTEIMTSKTEGGKLEKARKDWARTKVFSDKAKADFEFIQRPEIQLRLKLVEAGILASDYLNKHWREAVKARDVEIKSYLAAHSEYDVSKKHEKAEMVLQRAKSGEDFSKLAEEFSEDRRTNGKGGLYENVGRGYVWAEVENTALSMQPGQIADTLIETQTGFHIVKLEGRQVKKEKDGSEVVKFSVRHILLQKAFAEPNSNRPGIPPPFLTPQEIAIAEVEKEKYQAVVRELIRRNQITVNELSSDQRE